MAEVMSTTLKFSVSTKTIFHYFNTTKEYLHSYVDILQSVPKYMANTENHFSK